MTQNTNHLRRAVLANATTVATSLRMDDSQEAQRRRHQLKHFMQPGSEAVLPVSTTQLGFSLDQYHQAHRLFSPAHYQTGGDDALIYNTKLNEFLPSALAMPVGTGHHLPRSIDNDISELNRRGENDTDLSLNDYIALPSSRVQSVMMVQSGKVVFEQYPGMAPDDNHVWMSLSRNTVAIIFAQLISEGAVELDCSVSVYLPELRTSHWDFVSIRQALNHTTGLDVTQDMQTIFDPQSNISRFLAAEFGQPTYPSTEQEYWLDVVKQIQKLPHDYAGEYKRPSDITIAVLTYIAERVENQPWATLFEARVWGKVKAQGPILFALAPDGTALSHGLVQSTLEDAARFAMLFTPSWHNVAEKPVLSAQLHRSLCQPPSPKTLSAAEAFQFDKVYSDGARYKQGGFGQGMYIDPVHDFVAVYFSSQPLAYSTESSKMMDYLRLASLQSRTYLTVNED